MNRRTLFIVGMLVQLVAIFGLFLPYALIVSAGESVRLLSVPVDPWSPLRGEYVTLDYEIATGVTEADIGEMTHPLYAILEPGEDAYNLVGIVDNQPELTEGQVCLVASWNGWILRFPDIAQYFVEEGVGRELEQAQRSHRLYVDLRVTPSCQAVVTGVVFGPEVPPEEDPFQQGEFPGIPVRPVAE